MTHSQTHIHRGLNHDTQSPAISSSFPSNDHHESGNQKTRDKDLLIVSRPSIASPLLTFGLRRERERETSFCLFQGILIVITRHSSDWKGKRRRE